MPVLGDNLVARVDVKAENICWLKLTERDRSAMAYLRDASKSIAAPQQWSVAPDRVAAAEKLLGAVNDGAKSLKQLFFWYVTALTYAVISVAGVTDRQLFEASPLELPILKVSIPLVEYFAILPLVVLLAHLHLLVQFALLSNKLSEFQRELRHLPKKKRADFRIQLDDFMLSRFLAGRHRSILRSLLFILIFAALVLLPLFTLLLMQAQFLAYHSRPMVLWHRLLISTDTLFLLYFWPNLFHREDLKATAWVKLMLFRVLPRVVLLVALLAAFYFGLCLLHFLLKRSLLVVAAILGICVVCSVGGRSLLRLEREGKEFEARWFRWIWRFERFGRYLSRSFLCISLVAVPVVIAGLAWPLLVDHLDLMVAVPIAVLVALAALATFGLIAVRKKRSPLSLAALLLGYSDRSHHLARKYDGVGMTVFGIQCLLALAVSWFAFSVPSRGEMEVDLRLVCGGQPAVFDRVSGDEVILPNGGAGAVASNPFGIDERLLSLVLVSLAPDTPQLVSAARKATQNDHEDSKPKSCSSIWEGKISNLGINRPASFLDLLVGAIGVSRYIDQQQIPIEIEGKTREDRDAWAEMEDLESKGIGSIDLRGRDLNWTQLSGAIIPHAKGDAATEMQGANLDSAELQHASLDEANLRDVSLVKAHLQGATLRSATLKRADLTGANLENAVLIEADFTDAVLDDATLENANFVGSGLRGVTFDGARMTGAVLSGAEAIGASLEYATLRGASLAYGRFAGASLKSADLDAAVLASARLLGANLAKASLNGAFIRQANLRGADLHDATLFMAVIVDPKVWPPLGPSDASEMKIREEPSYARLQAEFMQRVDEQRGPIWGSVPQRCLLILSALPEAGTPLPNCQFKRLKVLDLRENLSSRQFTLKPLGPGAGNLQDFWREFAAFQADFICDAPASSANNPRYFARALTAALLSFEDAEEIQNAILNALNAPLSTEVCKTRWKAEQIEAALGQVRAFNNPHLKVVEDFYAGWLALIDKGAIAK